jgi:tryptophan 2,3-dioxygenase
MNRETFYAEMAGGRNLDYEIYLNTQDLLACQKPFDKMCNKDELQFQVVHQVEELWMKLLSYTLLDIDEYLEQQQVFRILSQFERCNRILKLMTDQLDLLETMSPKEYQQIRLQLGNGSGQESPGFRVLLKMIPNIWRTFEATYLTGKNTTVEQIYDSQYAHDELYAIAEAMVSFDEMFQKFRAHHIFLIQRSIGMGAASLKGRSVDLLQAGAKQRFFPALWDVRASMTDRWGVSYGRVRDSISSQTGAPGD